MRNVPPTVRAGRTGIANTISILTPSPRLNIPASLAVLAALVVLGPTGQAVSQSVVGFARPALSVAESDGAARLVVSLSRAAETAVSVDYSTSDGSGRDGISYNAVAGTLQFAPGETNRQVIVPIINDGFAQGTKTFRVLLKTPSEGAVLGSITNVNVSVRENDVGIQFVSATFSVREGDGAAEIGITRTEDGRQRVTVDIATTDMTAKSSLDYTGVSTSLTFAPWEVWKVVRVPILNNALKQTSRTFGVTLANATGASIGRQNVSVVNIADDDQGFRLEAASTTVGEEAGTVRIVVLRGTDDADSSASIDVATLDQTAQSGVDYLGATNRLVFGPGEVRQFLDVPILNDGVKESVESFRVCLGNPSADASVSTPFCGTVEIVDNDPQLGFEQPRYTNPWGGATELALTVVRGSDADMGPLTVDYFTADGTAQAGIDYQAASGTLRFEEHNMIQAVRIPVLANRPALGKKTFHVILSNPSNGAGLGRAVASADIEGSFLTVAPLFDCDLEIQRGARSHVLTWMGDGPLQRSDAPSGPWQILERRQSPVRIESSEVAGFYRIQNPRPVQVFVPSKYDGHSPLPLVIALHGLPSSGAEMERYLRLLPLAEARDFLYCFPDGLNVRDGHGWNAYFSSAAEASYYSYTWSDDVAFLKSLIQQVAQEFALDRKRVYLVGHSNGGGMAHRTAALCPDLIAGVASLAGNPVNFNPPPASPVNILQIHGTADGTVTYGDRSRSDPNRPVFPGAQHIGLIWAELNGAKNPETEPAPSMDLDRSLPGLDAIVTRWTDAPSGGAVEIWTISNGSHQPNISVDFSARMIDWLLAHPKP